MNYYEIPNKKIRLIEDYDVVIVGGGTAGAVAAVSSGREGLKTLLIEEYGSLGGTQTHGLVEPMMHNHIPDNPYSSAIDEEICDKMIEIGYGNVSNGNKGWFDSHNLKLVLEHIVLDAKCDIYYFTRLIDVIKKKDKIDAIVVHQKEGLVAIKAKIYIDCTGDADLVYYAGLKYESGDEDGINQAVSLRFQMTNIDCDKFGRYLVSLGQKDSVKYPYLHTAVAKGKEFPMSKVFEKMKLEGVLCEQDLKYFQVFSVPGKPLDLSFNCPELGGGKNILSNSFLSNRQIKGKKAINRLVNFLVKYIPGFEKAYICDIADMVGIRESRRAVTNYVLTKYDILEYKKFDDAIDRSNYPLDIHGGKEDDTLQFADVKIDEQYFEVPFRSLVVKDVENLLIAGRCAGADFLAQSTIRVQHTCRAMGEAVGIGAAISIRQSINCNLIDGKKVRMKMKERGGKL